MVQNRSSKFLLLPIEVRNQIFEHVLNPFPKYFSPVRPYRSLPGEFFGHRYRFKRQEHKRIRPLLLICQQIRDEILLIVLARCTVTIESMSACLAALSNFSALQAINKIELIVPVRGLPEANDPWQEEGSLVIAGLDGYHYYAQNYIRFMAWSDVTPQELGRYLQTMLPKVEHFTLNFCDIKDQWARPDCQQDQLYAFLEDPLIRDRITRLKFRLQYLRGHHTPYYDLEHLKPKWNHDTFVQGWRMCPWRYLLDELAKQCHNLTDIDF